MNGYVAAGYGVTVVTLATYSARVLWRGRRLARRVRARPAPGPDQDRLAGSARPS
ncbi:MAG: hypothetical protein ACRDZ9_08660 [Acidimicrobiales bacterium]